MARRRLKLVPAEPVPRRRRAPPEPEPEPRLPVSGLRYRVVKPETTAAQLDRFFADRKLEPHGDGSFENAEPIAEKQTRARSRRGGNKSST